MYELRVLNGLHRGAALPLDERPHVIGSSEDADVVLVDPGIEEHHATLSLTESGWALWRLNGEVLSADSNRPESSIDLVPGEFARVGRIWLTVADQEARWENPPPEPVDVPEEEVEEEAAAAAVEPTENAEDMFDPAVLDEPMVEPVSAGPVGAPAQAPAGKTRRFGKFDWRKPHMVVAPLAAVTVLSACAAYAFTSSSTPAHGSGNESAFKNAKINGDLKSKSASREKGKKTELGSLDEPDKKMEKGLSQEELRKAFRKRLADADLLKRFDLKLNDYSWTMHAALDDDEAARFERILLSFIKAHNIKFPVNAKVGSAETMLPFKIRQVISGSNASVVTQDGNRLYIGDEYQGVRLVAINGNRLTFAGKRKIEVKW